MPTTIDSYNDLARELNALGYAYASYQLTDATKKALGKLIDEVKASRDGCGGMPAADALAWAAVQMRYASVEDMLRDAKAMQPSEAS